MAIISHRHKFIFLKTRKTASGSLEIALGRVCGPEDQLCPTSDGKEFGVLEQNNQKKLYQAGVKDVGNLLGSVVKNTLKSGKPGFGYSLHKMRRIIKSSHFNARNMKQVCGQEIWNSYYKFCFERNPFDRLVSFYHWRIKKFAEPPSFKDFAMAVVEKNKKLASKLKATNFSNRPFYEIDGKIVVDRICLFENLEQEMKDFFATQGVPWDGNILHTKGGFRPERHYREYYDDELKEKCEQAFKFEMEHFGYSF